MTAASSLVELLAGTTRRRPRAEALVDGARRVTYDELWRRVTAHASFMQNAGLRTGERVALLLENSVEFVVAYYGTLAAGGTVVALNTAARARDLDNWIRHCGATWITGDAGHRDWKDLLRSAGQQRKVVQVGSRAEPADAAITSWETTVGSTPAGWQPVEVDPHAVAAIIYTSGTTGHPKGVTLSHRNLVSNVTSILSYLRLTDSDRIVNVLPFYYSYGNSVLHTHLAAGGCVIFENNLVYPHRTMERLAQEAATGFSGVPSTYALLLSRVTFEDYDLPALRYMTQAGGAMSPAAIARLTGKLPHVPFFVMYGQTEATSRLSYLPPEMLMAKPGSAGIAIPGVELEIRGDDGNPVARGVIGEIWARGENVMSGYWNDPEATREVLRNGWLRTGDLALMDEDGYIFIQGRRSDMIKSGAHRINPKDIEDVISEIEGVAEVAVVGIDDELLGQVIKAVVVPVPRAILDDMQIKAYCQQRLATYKIPKFVELGSELPKTASGKVKRFELAGRFHGQHG